MRPYYLIYDQDAPHTLTQRVIAILVHEEDAFSTFEKLMKSDLNMGLTYITLYRIETNKVGLVTARTLLAEEWAWYG